VRSRSEPASTLPIGSRLAAALDVARAAGLPVLLSGRSGIGKSEFVATYAATRELDACVLDLSLLEAADLTGLPYLRDGLTHFAPPAALPRQGGSGSSVLVLEELNRCDRSIRQPCLQLLSARRLNDYRLPESCWMVACINPADDHHDVEELDAAMASRFVRLSVHADRSTWIGWARETGLHPAVVGVVDRYAQALDAAPPRSWTQAARLVSAHAQAGAPPEALEPLVRAVLPPVAATTLLDALARGAGHEVVSAEDMVSLPTFHAGRIRVLAKEGRLDQVVEALRRLEEIASESPAAALEELLAAAPPDLRETWGPRILGMPRR
jgi:MoxR-like ATPase